MAQRTRTTKEAEALGLRVFVAGVPWHVEESTLRKDFEECGIVEDVFLMRDPAGNSRGKGMITFREQDAVKAALAFDSTEYGGRTIYVKVAEPKRGTHDDGKGPSAVGEAKKPRPKVDARAAEREGPSEKPAGCVSLCLKNIGAASEEEVRTLLKGCSIQSIRLVKDRLTGEPRGIAFVDFTDTKAVDKAMRRDGREIAGSQVAMRYEVPKERPRPEGCFCVCVKKLPPIARSVHLRTLFAGLKSLTDVRVIPNANGECSGLGFADFSDGADVEAAVRRDGSPLLGQHIFVGYETKTKKPRRRPERGPYEETGAEACDAGAASDDVPKKRKSRKSEVHGGQVEGSEEGGVNEEGGKDQTPETCQGEGGAGESGGARESGGRRAKRKKAGISGGCDVGEDGAVNKEVAKKRKRSKAEVPSVDGDGEGGERGDADDGGGKKKKRAKARSKE